MVCWPWLIVRTLWLACLGWIPALQLLNCVTLKKLPGQVDFLTFFLSRGHAVFVFLCLTYFTEQSPASWGLLLGCVCVCAQLNPAECDPMDCSLPGSSVHGIFQARILYCIAIPFSRGSSQSRDQTQVSCIAGGFFTIWATMEAQWRRKYNKGDIFQRQYSKPWKVKQYT